MPSVGRSPPTRAMRLFFGTRMLDHLHWLGPLRADVDGSSKVLHPCSHQASTVRPCIDAGTHPFVSASAPRQPLRKSDVDFIPQSFSPLRTSLFVVESACTSSVMERIKKFVRHSGRDSAKSKKEDGSPKYGAVSSSANSSQGIAQR